MVQLLIRWVGCLGLLLFLGSSLPGQYTPESIPNPKRQGRGYVSNPDNIISPTAVAQLNRLLAEMEDSTTAQVAVVIVESIGTANPKDFAHKLFNTWGIGQAGKDNGLLIFTVMDQRRTEFETGYGLEGVLPDVVCYRIGMQELVPAFKAGRYGEGLIRAVERIQLTLEDPAAAAEISANPNIRSNPYAPRGFLSQLQFYLLIYAGIVLFFTLFLIGKMRNILRSREELYDKYLDLRKLHYGIYFLLLPIPYILIYIFMRRRLQQLRYQPRFSRETGAPMHLISEQEEDAYLEAGQVTEEEIGSADYDVWATEQGDDLLILRYKKRHTQYRACPECNFTTYYQAYSQTVRYATYSSTGRRKIVHECKNCRHREVSFQTIPMKTRSSSSGGGSGGGFSGGSSSWGGGRSGGGGAGVSW